MLTPTFDPDTRPLPVIVKPKRPSGVRDIFNRRPSPQNIPVPYKSLKDDEIRLVNLHPGLPSSPITLATEIVSAASAEYTALSYVWGDASQMIPIHVDNHIFQATKNLYSALHHIRLFLEPSSSKVISLWIDAVSINQRDLAERSHQVSRMSEIYISSNLVLTWLGPGMEAGLSYLRDLGDHALSHLQSQTPGPLTILPHHIEDHKTIREAVGIFQSNYWNRVWTVQEYTAPTNFGVFMSGTVWMDRSAFFPAVMLYIQALDRLRETLRKKGLDASFVDATLWRVRKVRNDLKMSYSRAAAMKHGADSPAGSESGREHNGNDGEVCAEDSKKRSEKVVMGRRFQFINLLLRFRELQATDPRDRIYAPLNLVKYPSPTQKPLVPVDYTFTVRQLYTSVAKCILEDEVYWPLSNLEICRYAASSDLPSWVPDWRVLPRKILSRQKTTGEQILCASRGLATKGQSSWKILDEDMLQVRAIQVDAVTELWEAFDTNMVPLTKRYPSYKLKNPGEKYAAANYTVIEAFRALAGIDPTSEITATKDKVGAVEPEKTMEAGCGEIEILSQADWHQNTGMAARLNRRRLARTSRGFVGLVAAEAVEGDTIWLIPGANMFHILRPVSEAENHLLIGEVYLQGVMHGEIFNFLGSDVEKQIVITLV